MIGQRKKIKADIKYIYRIMNLYENKKYIFISRSSEEQYNLIYKYLETVLHKAQAEHDKMPKGHIYKGVFYICKSNYNSTTEVLKIKGSAFMREDLTFWNLDVDGEYSRNLYRKIYKDKDLKIVIQREDAEPIFEKNYSHS